MPGRITVAGSANVDFVMRLPRLPRKGETVLGGPFSQTFGGKGSNQALAARRAGGTVSMIASLGDDAFGRELMAVYEREGIGTADIRLHQGVPCGAGMMEVDANGDNTIATALGANELLSADQIGAAEKTIAASSLVMLQMETPDEAIRRAVELARRHGVDVMLNYAPARESSIPLTPDIAILIVNETEAERLSGVRVESIAGAIGAAEKLAAGGHRLVAVTLGANGCVMLENGAAAHFPAFRVDAVDATAAGDVFCGALAVGLTENMPPAEAARFAAAAGALCASRMGALPSLPSRNDIDAFLDERNGE